MNGVKGFASITLASLLSVSLWGCGGGKSTKGGVDVEDPIHQEIVEKAKKTAPQVVPPGYVVNSGGELVKIEKDEENQ